MVPLHSRPLHALIFGAGAIGTYLGVSLAIHGHPCVFLERPESAPEIVRHGVRLSHHGRLDHLPDPDVAISLEDAMQQGPYDVAIFAIKSYDTHRALAAFTPDLADHFPPVLCLQNGVDNEARLSTILGAGKVIPGTVTSALQRRSVGDVILERPRGLGIAGGHPLSGQLVQGLKAAGINARLYPRANEMKWSKLLTNLLGNATSAILDMTPNQIFSHPGLFRLEAGQLREALSVMAAQGIVVTDLPGTPVRALAFVIRRFPTRISRLLIQRAVARGRGGKMPSLHIDFHSGKEQSEVMDLNGAVVRYGEELGVPTPTNRFLAQTLVSLVKKEVAPDTYAHQPDRLLRAQKVV